MTARSHKPKARCATATIDVDRVALPVELAIPSAPRGLAMLSWSGRDNHAAVDMRALAQLLNEVGFATLLIGLLSAHEETEDGAAGSLRFNPILLSRRLVAATDWVGSKPETAHLAVGYFAVATAATGALLAAVERPERVRALVSVGGRPDLVAARLAAVVTPTLLIVGDDDTPVCRLNRLASTLLGGQRQLAVVPRAPRLDPQPNLSIEVAGRAIDWFMRFVPDERPA